MRGYNPNAWYNNVQYRERALDPKIEAENRLISARIDAEKRTDAELEVYRDEIAKRDREAHGKRVEARAVQNAKTGWDTIR